MRRFTPMQQNFIDEYILSLDQTESANGLKPLVERIYKSLYQLSSLIPKSRYENLNFKDRLDILLEMRLSGVAE